MLAVAKIGYALNFHIRCSPAPMIWARSLVRHSYDARSLAIHS
jgi:hypothetical protein